MAPDFSILEKINAAAKNDEQVKFMTSTLIELNRSVKNPEVSLAAISQIVSKDAMFSATVLKVANSPSFGMVKQVSTVAQGVNILGLDNLRKLISVKAVVSAFQSQGDPFWEDIFKHCLGVACLCKNITDTFEPEMSEIMFGVGLLHDVGVLLIAHYLPDKMSEIKLLLERDENKRLLVAETEVLGFTHQDVGAFFAKEWQFPEIYEECLAHHHYYDQVYKAKKYIAVVLAANNMAKGMGLGKSPNLYVEPVPQAVWNLLSIREYDFYRLVKPSRDDYDALIYTID